MTIPVAIATSLIAGGAAFFIAFVGVLINISTKLGRLDGDQENLAQGQLKLEKEICATRDYFAAQLAAAEERAIVRETAAEKRAVARESAAEERALARHNELLAEIRLWRTHGHDADGNIFFRVPE